MRKRISWRFQLLGLFSVASIIGGTQDGRSGQWHLFVLSALVASLVVVNDLNHPIF